MDTAGAGCVTDAYVIIPAEEILPSLSSLGMIATIL